MAKKKVLSDMEILPYVDDEKLRKRFLEQVDLEVIKPETLEELMKLDLSKYWALIRGEIMEHYVKSTEFFRKANNLIAITHPGAGYDDIDIKAATQEGVMVSNTPGVMAQDVVEHTIMLMIAAAKHLASSDKELREGQWDWAGNTGIRLWGKKLAQIGLGRIGSMVAETCRTAFNMQVLVYDPYTPDWQVVKVGGKRMEFDEILREGDVFTINVLLTPETTHMFGIEEFRKMKRTAIVVNTARGKVIKEPDLVQALNEKLIYAAGIDVFEQEPPSKDDPLFRCRNAVLTQHCASNTREGAVAMFEGAVKNLLQVIDGKPPMDLINREVLQSEKLRFRAYQSTLRT